MKIALSLLLAAALLTTGVAGCTARPAAFVASAAPTEGDPARVPDPALATAINGFGFDLMRQNGQGVDRDDRENVVVSPLSIHAALTMTLNGAGGETAREMLSTLHLERLGLDAANASYADLLAALGELDSSADTTLTVANSLWPHVDFDIEADFVETNRRFFGAQLEPIDLTAPDAADIINAWIAEQTAGDITELIDQVPPATDLYLINAVHIDAAWDGPFDPNLTRDGDFHTGLFSKSLTVPFLNRTGTYRYSESTFGQAIRLPTKGGRLGVWVLVPTYWNHYKMLGLGLVDADVRLDEAIGSLDTDTWREITDAAEEREVALALPRFDLRYSTELREDLEAMGMSYAFSNAADFSDIAPSNDLFISRVLHETRFVVNEEGARASAATAVELARGDAALDQVTMTVNRPFLIAIEDEPSGALLFLGAIYDPR